MAHRSVTIVAQAVLALAIAAASPVATAESEEERYRALAASESAFTRAVSAHRRGNLERARDGYVEAIARDPAFVEAMVNLARVHVSAGDLDAAAALLDRAETVRPHYPAIDAVRGLLAFEEGDSPAATDELSEAAHAMPKDIEVLNNLGASLIAQGRLDEAIEVLDEARRLDRARPMPVYNLALAYDRAGDHPRAGHYYARYLQLGGRYADSGGAVAARLALLRGEPVPEPASVAAGPPASEANPDARASEPKPDGLSSDTSTDARASGAGDNE